MTEATFRTQQTPEGTIVAVHGDIDLSNAHDLSDAVYDAITSRSATTNLATNDRSDPARESPSRVWIDLTHTTYLDSAGINTLAALNRDLTAPSHPTLGVIAPAGSIARRALEVVHFDRLMPLTDTTPPATEPS